jgi:hypothetical protein
LERKIAGKISGGGPTLEAANGECAGAALVTPTIPPTPSTAFGFASIGSAESDALGALSHLLVQNLLTAQG